MFKVLFLLIVMAFVIIGCKKEQDPNEYREGTLVTFVGQARPGYEPPLTIDAVSARKRNEIVYFAHDMRGKKLNDLSEFEIKKWER